MVSVRAVDISKRFGDFLAVNHVNIEAKDRELITLLGPSGCGKTTTLRIISGLVKPDTGEVYFGEKNVTNVPPHKRNIGFVFQKVALFPHMNVYKNVSFGLKMKKFPKNEIDKRVKEVLKIVRMEGFEERMPSQLSGGQVQRIDIARVLAIDPEVLLFDEPLGHLDAKLRDDLKYEIRRIQKETGKTAIYVTHDQAEAFAISDRIYVMNHGQVQQVGTPIELYLNPKSDFVADFIGTSNFLEGTISEIYENRLKIKVNDGLILVSEVMPNVQEYKVNDNVIVSIRPEDIELLENLTVKENSFEAKVERSMFLGTNTRLLIALGNRILKVDLYGPERFKIIDTTVSTNFHVRRFTIIKKT